MHAGEADRSAEDGWAQGDPRTGRLLRVLMQGVAAGDAAALRAAGTEGAPCAFDDVFLRTAFGHGLGLAAAWAVEETGDASCGAERTWRAAMRVRTGEELLRDDALAEIGRAAEAAGVCVVGVRGSGRIARAWPDPALRQRSDLDLIVFPEEREPFRAIAAGLGFEPLPTEGHTVLRRGAVTLDLAQRPTDIVRQTAIRGEERTFGDLDRGWTAAVRPGAVAGIRELRAPFALVLGALHYGYKHRFLRHAWGLDLVLLARGMSEAEQAEAAELVGRTGTSGLVCPALNQAARATGMDPFGGLRAALPPPRRGGLRERLFARCMAGPTGPDTGRMLMLACARDAGFVARVAGRALVPPRGELRRQGLAREGAPGAGDYLRHLARIPGRLARAVR